jgi:TetR/AcrR family fatty acid metabolism transcriptional regulator
MSVFDVKKIRILVAATLVFSQKGYRDATISDLARKAELGEATIYNHFKNKEQILFSIAIQGIQDLIDNNAEHLTGIKNPEEKLRKFIWQYLWWSQQHKPYIKVFLLEIQSNPRYHQSEAYLMFKKMVEIPLVILEEGKQTGLFREDVNPRLFGSMVLGTMNYLFLSRILFDRSFTVLDDFDDIAGVMLAAIRLEAGYFPAKNNGAEGKREKILIAAEQLFSRDMFFDTTISNIAQKAGVADGTIYEYFKNKDDLLFSIFGKRMQEFMNTFDEALSPRKPETKLRHILWHFLTWSQNNRLWTRIYFKDLIPNPRFYRSNKHKAMRRYDDKLVRVIKEGQEKGVFRMDLKVYLIRAILYGTMDHLCSPWAMLFKDYNLVTELENFYDLLYRAIMAPKQA